MPSLLTTIPLLLLTTTTTVLAGDGKWYDSCRCVSLNVAGKAGGVSMPDETKKACDIWRNQASGWETGTWDFVDGWCKQTSGTTASRFSGDRWWDICDRQTNANAGQCTPYGGLH